MRRLCRASGVVGGDVELRIVPILTSVGKELDTLMYVGRDVFMVYELPRVEVGPVKRVRGCRVEEGLDPAIS